MNIEAILKDRKKIIQKSIGFDYDQYTLSQIAFDYERMMSEQSLSYQQIIDIQNDLGVGQTPLIELKNINSLVRQLSPDQFGARIFLKDEACNPSGSFKARRAAISCYLAKKMGYQGVLAATSGNYGAAVAAMCAKLGLKCLILQECYDSHGLGQPEILEKARACEAYGAQVIQLTVGPELFVVALDLLNKTGFFNASLYSPYGIAGLETLGVECVEQIRQLTQQDPDAIVITHAGGGNVTATARGALRVNSQCQIIAASVDLKGLHMASDVDFNRKSFTTGHTGFGIPFAINPDRSDVPYSAARPLRYLDRYVTVKQGEVFYATELLARWEGLERGPAGNTSLAAAFVLAQRMRHNQTIVVQETEYTSAGKHSNAQLSFAKKQGIQIKVGNPEKEVAGQSIVFPQDPRQMRVSEIDCMQLRSSYIKHRCENLVDKMISQTDVNFLAKDTKSTEEFVLNQIERYGIEVAI